MARSCPATILTQHEAYTTFHRISLRLLSILIMRPSNAAGHDGLGPGPGPGPAVAPCCLYGVLGKAKPRYNVYPMLLITITIIIYLLSDLFPQYENHVKFKQSSSRSSRSRSCSSLSPFSITRTAQVIASSVNARAVHYLMHTQYC